MSFTDVPLDPPPDTNLAAITGSDALGVWLDTGIACVPTTRPSVEQDIHTTLPALSARKVDTGVASANAPKLSPALHSITTARR